MKYIPKASVAEQLTIKTSKKRAEERLSNVEPNEMKVLDEMQAFIAYLEGGSVEEISEHFEINVDTFKYKLKKLKACGIKGFMDLRDTNGSYQEKSINKEIGQRIIEIKIAEPTLGLMGISKKLFEQDRTQISHTTINEFLHEIGLNDYCPSPYMPKDFSP
jgi:transposase